VESARFLNRELSWLEFNQRVLDEARDPSVPLLERLKFLAIVSTRSRTSRTGRCASWRPSVPPSVLPGAQLVVVHLPSQVIPRFVRLPGEAGRHEFMLLEDGIRLHLPLLYNGYEAISCHAIRVTRDAEFELDGTGAPDLLTEVEKGLRGRRMGAAVRLQFDADLDPDVLATLVAELELDTNDLYPGAAFTAFADLFQLYAAVDETRLKEAPRAPLPVPAFEAAPDVWSAIRAGDVLVHHPYQSFDVVTRFVPEAAGDPRVLAIKMTLYRVSPTSPIAQALTMAAEQGKEVAVLVASSLPRTGCRATSTIASRSPFRYSSPPSKPRCGKSSTSSGRTRRRPVAWGPMADPGAPNRATATPYARRMRSTSWSSRSRWGPVPSHPKRATPRRSVPSRGSVGKRPLNRAGSRQPTSRRYATPRRIDRPE